MHIITLEELRSNPELVAELKSLIDGGGKSVKPGKVAPKKAKPVEDEEADDDFELEEEELDFEEETEEEESEVTLDMLRKKVNELTKVGKEEFARQALTKFKAKTLSQVKADKYGDLYALLEKGVPKKKAK
jgi:hypothetical protein